MNLVIGMLLIVLGVVLVVYYQKIQDNYGKGGLSFKLRTGGIGFVMIGIYLIIDELY